MVLGPSEKDPDLTALSGASETNLRFYVLKKPPPYHVAWS